MTDTPQTPAQQEQAAYNRTTGVLAIRDDQFAEAPAYIPGDGEWAGLKEMARAMSVTEFVPKDMRGRPFAVLGALLTGRDLGLPPMMALRQIYVVNGRPSLQGAVKAALVRRTGHKITVGDWTTEKCTVRGWRKGDSPDDAMEVTYTIEDAKLAGDYDKAGDMYKKRPRQMLYWRAVGLLCDTYFSDVTLGLPDPEESVGLEPEPVEAVYHRIKDDDQLPGLRTDIPLTDEERAQVEAERQEEAAKRLAEATPPPPPRLRGRGKGPRPNPQQGSDSGASSTATPASSSEPTAPTLAATSETKREAEPPLPPAASPTASTMNAQSPSPASSSETAGDAPTEFPGVQPGSEGASSDSPAAGGDSVAGAATGPAGDPFAGNGAEPQGKTQPPPMAQLVQRAETYADFLMRARLERLAREQKKPLPTNLADIHQQALSALEQVCKQMLGHGYGYAGANCTEKELDTQLLPWLRERYAKEGGKE